ncbi:MAG: hypothetical protein JF616_16355 [Fibrobacteres bacterium]|jgi:hypothetical protein|nr:hypothetical protein [Fibrobacterota bacterium]
MPFAFGPRAVFCLTLACMAVRAAAGYPFALHPEHARYLLGEPVYLRMDGAHGRPPTLEEGTTILVIRAPDGGEHLYRPPLRFRSRPGADGPGAVPGLRYARLIAEGGGWVFPRPGRYVLRLRAPAEAGARGERAAAPGFSKEAEALSDTVSVEIAAPSAPEDKRAFEILSRAPGEYALAVYLEGGDQLRSGMDVIRELAALPNRNANQNANGYERVAAFVLCSDWGQDFRARSGGEGRPMDLGKALAFAHWDKGGGVYLPLRTAFRMRAAIALRSARDPTDPDLASARARLSAFEDSLTADERSILASF